MWSIILIVALVLVGLIVYNTSGPLNYSDLIEKPNAKIVGDSIEIFLGYAKSPIWWVNPDVKIVNTKILISAKWSNMEHPKSITLRLPQPEQRYQIFWVDEDGKMTEIQTLTDGK